MATERVTEVEGQLLCVQFMNENEIPETSPAVLVNDSGAVFVILLDDQGYQRAGFDPIPFPFADDSPFSIVDSNCAIIPYEDFEGEFQQGNQDDLHELDTSGDKDKENEPLDHDSSRLEGLTLVPMSEPRQKRKYTKRNKGLMKLENDTSGDIFNQSDMTGRGDENDQHCDDALMLTCESFDSPYLTDEVEIEEFPEGKRISAIIDNPEIAEKARKMDIKVEGGYSAMKKMSTKIRKIQLNEKTIRMMRDNAMKRPRDEGGRFIPGVNRRKLKKAENAVKKEMKRKDVDKIKPVKKKTTKIKLNEDTPSRAHEEATDEGDESESFVDENSEKLPENIQDKTATNTDENVTVKIEVDEAADYGGGSVVYGNGIMPENNANNEHGKNVSPQSAESELNPSNQVLDNNTHSLGIMQTDGAACFSDDSLTDHVNDGCVLIGQVIKSEIVDNEVGNNECNTHFANSNLARNVPNDIDVDIEFVSNANVNRNLEMNVGSSHRSNALGDRLTDKGKRKPSFTHLFGKDFIVDSDNELSAKRAKLKSKVAKSIPTSAKKQIKPNVEKSVEKLEQHIKTPSIIKKVKVDEKVLESVNRKILFVSLKDIAKEMKESALKLKNRQEMEIFDFEKDLVNEQSNNKLSKKAASDNNTGNSNLLSKEINQFFARSKELFTKKSAGNNLLESKNKAVEINNTRASKQFATETPSHGIIDKSKAKLHNLKVTVGSHRSVVLDKALLSYEQVKKCDHLNQERDKNKLLSSKDQSLRKVITNRGKNVENMTVIKTVNNTENMEHHVTVTKIINNADITEQAGNVHPVS